ncbi:hypothetical protein [Streptomyces sp. NPDC058657]|uniref:hypothetical protein n=1 Tax=unclassified Streptomyces TaxID=2593676 RepID=UPI00366958AC
MTDTPFYAPLPLLAPTVGPTALEQRLYRAGCLGKTRFRSRRAARRRARQIHGIGGPRYQAYRCLFCLGVHLGHQEGHATHLRGTRYGPIPAKDLTA